MLGSWRKQTKEHLRTRHRFFQGKRALDGRREYAKLAKRNIRVITFLAVNYEMMWRRYGVLVRLGFDMVILDESHRIKARNSAQSKAAHRLGMTVDHKLILTGTPIDEDELDLWSQFKFLDHTLLGDWKKFVKTYLKKAGFGGYGWKIRTNYLKDRLHKVLGAKTFIVKKREVLDLPPEQDSALYFELTGKAKKAYEDLEEGFYTEYDGATSIPEMAATQMIRLRQLTGGFLALNNEEEVIQLEQDKLITFIDWMEDFPKTDKLVIFAQWRQEIDILNEALKKRGWSVGVIDGRTKKAEDVWIPFQEKKHPQIALCQMRSGGIGIDLFRACTAFIYSGTFSRIDYEQAKARLSRRGQERAMNFIHMVAEGTIDEDLVYSLDQKGNLADIVMNRLNLRRKKT